MNGRPLLEAEGLRVSYGTHEVIRGVSFALRESELTALLGLNGSGKSTLLKILCGLQKPGEGRCFVDGTDSASLRAKSRARQVCYVPQRAGIAYSTPVEEVVLMGRNPHLPLLGMPGRADRERMHEALGRLGIAHLRTCDFLQLSEGQKQLVILARAIVQDAPVLLLDEPDSALDFVNRHLVLSQIRSAAHGRGRCGLITLHDPNFALAYCDRILLLNEGRICGELAVAGASRQTVETALSKVYGALTVLDYPGGFAVVRKKGEIADGESTEPAPDRSACTDGRSAV